MLWRLLRMLFGRRPVAVYLMTRTGLPGVKIGRAKDPHRRQRDGSTWVPEGLHLVTVWWCDDEAAASAVETAAHELASNPMQAVSGRGGTEWFGVREHEARAYVRQGAKNAGETIHEQGWIFLRYGLSMSYYRWRWAAFAALGGFLVWTLVWYVVGVGLADCQGWRCDWAWSYERLVASRFRQSP